MSPPNCPSPGCKTTESASKTRGARRGKEIGRSRQTNDGKTSRESTRRMSYKKKKDPTPKETSDSQPDQSKPQSCNEAETDASPNTGPVICAICWDPLNAPTTYFSASPPTASTILTNRHPRHLPTTVFTACKPLPHEFHRICLLTWLNSAVRDTCPTCRQRVSRGLRDWIIHGIGRGPGSNVPRSDPSPHLMQLLEHQQGMRLRRYLERQDERRGAGGGGGGGLTSLPMRVLGHVKNNWNIYVAFVIPWVVFVEYSANLAVAGRFPGEEFVGKVVATGVVSYMLFKFRLV